MSKIVDFIANIELYEYENKKGYLESQADGTAEFYYQIFKAYAGSERKYGKDIYDFTLDELEKATWSLKLGSYSTYYTYSGTIRRYIDYAIDIGLKSDVNNPFEGVYTEWVKQFKTDKDYFTENEINNIVDKCINPQDAVIIQLLFEGVMGIKRAELINLKNSDVKRETRTLTLTDKDGTKRQIQVSQKCIDLIDNAVKKEIYHKRNGEAISKSTSDRLVENEYVIRRLALGSGGKESSDLTKTADALINRRLAVLSDVLGEGTRLKKPKLINDSGKFCLVKNIYSEYRGVVKDIALDKLNKQFNIKKVKTNGTVDYSYKEKSFVNPDEIFKVYGIHFENDIGDFVLINPEDKDTDISEQAEQRRRINQNKFRDRLIEVYEGMCVITGEKTESVLESAHIQPYINEHSHHPQNGLLLRIDLHRLFDKHLLTIDKVTLTVKISNKIESERYRKLNNIKIRMPINSLFKPSYVALKEHNQIFDLINKS